MCTEYIEIKTSRLLIVNYVGCCIGGAPNFLVAVAARKVTIGSGSFSCKLALAKAIQILTGYLPP